MRGRRYCAVVLWIGAAQLAPAAEHKAAIRAGAEGAGAAIGSPVVGYFRSSSGLVVVEGISSAAHARAVQALDADRVILPPGQGYEWVERGGQVAIATLAGGSLTSVADAWAGADLMAFNSSGGAAVLYRTGGGLQLIGGLPAAAHVLRSMALPQGTNDAGAIAISDDASTVLLATAVGVYEASADGTWTFMMPDRASAVAFLPGRSDAMVAGDGEVYLLKGSTPIPLLQTDGAARSILATDDGLRAVVLDANGRQAEVVDLGSGATTSLALGIAARELQRGRGGAILFLPENGRSPWIFDTRTGALSFAPELPEVTQ